MNIYFVTFNRSQNYEISHMSDLKKITFIRVAEIRIEYWK